MSDYDVAPEEIFFDASDEPVPILPTPRVRHEVLTDQFARSLSPGAKEFWIFDRQDRGFCVRVRASGARHYYYYAKPLEAGDKVIKKSLGNVDVVPCKQARARASALAQERMLDLLTPGNAQLRRATLAEAYSIFFPRGPGTEHERRGNSLVSRFVIPALGNMQWGAISRSDYLACINAAAQSRRTCANELQKHLKTFLYWGVEKGFLHANPLARLPIPAPPRRRSTLLDKQQIARLYMASREMEWPWSGMIATIILNGLSVEGARGLHQDRISWSQGLYCPIGCNPDWPEHWEVFGQQALAVLSPSCNAPGYLFASPRRPTKPYRLRVSILVALKDHADISSDWSWVDLVRSVRAVRDAFMDKLPCYAGEDNDELRMHRRSALDAWALELLRLHDLHLAELKRKQLALEDIDI